VEPGRCLRRDGRPGPAEISQANDAISGSTAFCPIAIYGFFHSNEFHIPTLNGEDGTQSMFLRDLLSSPANVGARAAGTTSSACRGK
jgi:hypothetical protein